MNVRKHYTWQSHAHEYAGALLKLAATNQRSNFDKVKPSDPIGRRLMNLNHFMITDIDNTLVGTDNTQLEKLLHLLNQNRDHMGFGVATLSYPMFHKNIEIFHYYLKTLINRVNLPYVLEFTNCEFRENDNFLMFLPLRESRRNPVPALPRACSKLLRLHPWRLGSESLRLLQR
jgi:hypothetical protein